MDVHSLLVSLVTSDGNGSFEDDHLIDDPEQLEQQHLYTIVSFALSFVTLIFAVTGTATNAISVFLYTRPTMRSSMNMLLAGLSTYDMCFSVLSIPTFAVPPMCIYRPDQWMVLCSITTFSTLYIYPLTTVAKTGSVWTLVYITVQRWFTVRRPFSRARGSSIALAKRALVAIFLAAVIYNAPRFFEHQSIDDPMEIRGPIKVKEYLRLDPIYMSIYYSILYLLTHFVVPFTILAYINGTMTCTIRRALKQGRMLSHSEKAAAMMATVVFVFVCCNTLPFVMNFVEFIDRNLFVSPDTKVSVWAISDFSNILCLINASLNIFIYYFCNQKYAEVFRRYLADNYRFIKERFNHAGGPARMRFGMETRNGFRGPDRRCYPHSQSASPPPYAVYAAKAAMAYRYQPAEADQPSVAPFDASPKCSLIMSRPIRKRSRSVFSIGWRGRLRSGTGFGRSLSSTALTMVDQQAKLSLAGTLWGPEAQYGQILEAAQRRRILRKTSAVSMRSLF